MYLIKQSTHALLMTTAKEGKIWFSIRLYYCFVIDLVMHFFLANLIGRSWRTWKKNWIRHTYLTQVCFELILYHICKLLPITIWLWKISHNKRAVWLVMRIIRLGMTILHFLELRSYDQQSLHIKDTMKLQLLTHQAEGPVKCLISQWKNRNLLPIHVCVFP